MATNWLDFYNEMTERVLHDSQLRSAIFGPQEISPEIHVPSPGGEAGGGAAVGAPPDDEGLNAAQWEWVTANQRPSGSQ
jgi:hypothetical protein